MCRRKWTLWIMALILLWLPALSLAAEPVALANGDFAEVSLEDGLPLGWFSEAWLSGEEDQRISRTVDESGAFCLRIENFVENDTRLCQTIPAETDTVYRLS